MSAVIHERALLAPLVRQQPHVPPALAAALSIRAGYYLPSDIPFAPIDAPASIDDVPTLLAPVFAAAGLRFQSGILPADCLGLLATRGPLVVAATTVDDDQPGMLVVWRRFGPLAHVLDTRAGRLWITVDHLAELTHESVYQITGEAWHRQVEASVWIMRSRLIRLVLDEAASERLLQQALADPGWRPLATLDAALRMVANLAATGTVERGNEAQTLIEQLVAKTLEHHEGLPGPIPVSFWTVWADAEQPDGMLCCRGVSLAFNIEPVTPGALDYPKLTRVRHPNRFASYWGDQPGILGLIGTGLSVAAAGVVAQTLILRGVLSFGQFFPTLGERAVVMGLLLGFVSTLFLLEVSLSTLLGRLGRRIDARLRMAFMTLLPRLGNQTFQRFSTADLMERIHTVRDLHNLPDLTGQLVRTFFQILFTLVGLALISPLVAGIGLINVLLIIGLLLAGAEVANAQNYMVRIALANLSRLTLDGMLGSMTIHAHLAAAALHNKHELLLARWVKRAQALAKTELWTSALETIITAFLVALSVVLYSLSDSIAHLPLLLFWSLQLGTLSEQLARTGFLYVGELSKGERYLALTDLPTDVASAVPAPDVSPSASDTGVAITLDGIDVEHDGQTILNALHLHIAPGSHVAIVGASGAGKSTLVGLLLGRFVPARGTLLVDDTPLTGLALSALRTQTAWVDPGVQIWNRSFLTNITYGSDRFVPHVAVDIIAGALIEQLPNGMQSTLGERGRLVSGGQGQRVRYGRAVHRYAARLVILDEPFRGLDREDRQVLLEHARACWPEATMLCVTHDIAHTTTFDRVLVLANGHVVEDGCPADLAMQGGAYAALLKADHAVDAQIWAGGDVPWRRVTLRDGQLESQEASAPAWPSSPPPANVTATGTGQANADPDDRSSRVEVESSGATAQAELPQTESPINALTWDEAQLPELLQQLARAGFGNHGVPEVAAEIRALAYDQQIAHVVDRCDLEAESFNLSTDSLNAFLHHVHPTLLRLNNGRWLALLAGGRWWVWVITVAGKKRLISTFRLRAIIRNMREREAHDIVAHLLAPFAFEERQRELAARALIRDQLSGKHVAQGWSLRPKSETALWAQVRWEGIPQALLFIAFGEALLSGLFVLSIGAGGLLAAQGTVIWPWIAALVLGILSAVPIDLLKRHYHLVVSIRLRTLLKRRLHTGVNRLMPNDIQQYGIGQFLSWLMEAERLESIVNAGPLLINSLVSLLICAGLLAGGAAGGWLALLLFVWLVVTAFLSWRAYWAYLAQRICHIETSRDTLERLDGQLTRLVQEHQTTWHDDEDAALERYLVLSKHDDHYRAILATLVPYGWLLLALAVLTPTLITWSINILALGVSLLGVTWGFQLLRTLGSTILEISRAVGAWQLLAPIEQSTRKSANSSEPYPNSSLPPSTERPILEIRNLSFGYFGQREPLLSHCDLAIYPGERLLLTGPSGGGKSTLASLLARLRHAQSGLLLLNGLDHHTLDTSIWRRQVVMVAQFHENHLFSASMAFNLLLGRCWPPCPADLREAEQICAELGLADLLQRMPAGLAEHVGEGGWQLSHGERSRLYVARALLQQAPVLILDESLTAVDAANLRATMNCVLARVPTLILIAHP